MAKDANVFARVDASLKEQAEGILSQLGMPMSSAIEYLVVLHQQFPNPKRTKPVIILIRIALWHLL